METKTKLKGVNTGLIFVILGERTTPVAMLDVLIGNWYANIVIE